MTTRPARTTDTRLDARGVTSALQGRWHGSYGYVRCPVHPDRRPSLRLRDGDSGNILVMCHAGCDPTTILRCLPGGNAPRLTQAEQDAAALRQAKADRKRELARISAAHSLWVKANHLGHHPPYFQKRGITVPLPGCIRWSPNIRHPDTQIAYPAFVVGLKKPDGAFAGVHRIYVTRDGEKAPLDSQKLSLGSLGSAAARLALAGSEMAVGEGVETCLSFQQLTGIPTWATLTTSGLRGFQPPAACRHLHILVDNDQNDAGHRAAEALGARLTIPYEFRRSPIGKDWNDAVMAAMPE